MLNDEIRRYIKAQPFEPFEIELVTGRVLRVNHHDFVLLPPGPRVTHFYWADPETVVGEVNHTNLVVAVRHQGARKKRRKAG